MQRIWYNWDKGKKILCIFKELHEKIALKIEVYKNSKELNLLRPFLKLYPIPNWKFGINLV